MTRSAHVDTFARDNLPSRTQWPELLFELPELQYPARLNCATELLDRMVAGGHGDRVLIRTPDGRLLVLEVNSNPSWRGLQSVSDVDIADAIVEDFLLAVGAHQRREPCPA